MKKLLASIIVLISLSSCEIGDSFEDRPYNLSRTTSYDILITGNCPMIQISTEDYYYYGLQYNVDYKETIKKETTWDNEKDTKTIKQSITITKMTSDSTEISASMSYLGEIVSSDSTTEPNATIVLTYTHEITPY